VAEPRWLEVSMVVDGELAEAIADVLGRFVSNGVVIESEVKFNDAEDEGTPYGPVKIYGFMAIDDQIEETRQRLLEGLWYLGRIKPLPEPQFRTIEDEDWMASWKQHYKPIPIGKRLLILPIWIQLEMDGRIPVRIDPSMAFGTGTHPTTQLCLEMIEEYTPAGQSVIDVGCGSGILSIAAIKMGAKHALGVDIDNAAIKSTRENAQANAVESAIETGIGSVEEVLQGKFSIQNAPLVLANILAPIIIRLFNMGLADLVSPSGMMILSGILDAQAPAVIEAAEAHGLRFIKQNQQDDWVAIAMQK
jgi:ribosomal protein L11 methyltransferase